MSFQVQPQQQQPQQPGQVYPPASPSKHSNGNFGPVFIVLAIILVVSVIACFLGRLCNKKYQKQKSQKLQDHKFCPRNQGDVEFGFDHKKMPPMPSAKDAAAAGIGGGRGFKPHTNGEMKGFDQIDSRGVQTNGNGEVKGIDQMKPSQDEGDQQKTRA